ncbi:MAG: hypothetical protein CMD78_07035 [Gammaproteobacteria bacterium]|jgi:uncharacterized protein (DUF1330 family)|nr:hypothetical protein [Gammaproteobacteria bacterium]|tara:strand:- start:55 stop:417 length:363 start_codon:yes stop_codon:yes gene_type:complete
MALNPTQEQIQKLLQSGHEGPVAMVNLLTFKDKNSYLRYAAGVEKIGGEFGLKLLFWGDVVTTVIGEDVEFQTIAIMEYPSLQAFIEFASSKKYDAIKKHRIEGLESQFLVATKQLKPED